MTINFVRPLPCQSEDLEGSGHDHERLGPPGPGLQGRVDQRNTQAEVEEVKSEQQTNGSCAGNNHVKKFRHCVVAGGGRDGE